jgi:selenocysteine lyase/cysteine desulfurase
LRLFDKTSIAEERDMSSGSSQKVRYEATGRVANARLAPLMPSDWIDSTDQGDDGVDPDFLWENATRRESKGYRDTVQVYSHLPNGENILDSKWALGRLFSDAIDENDPLLATLETHCFRGLDGFESFGQKINLFAPSNEENDAEESSSIQYQDMLSKTVDDSAPLPKAPSNLWVVKDAMSNGAGGVWVVGPENASKFCIQETSPLYPEHRYVAQRYVWPPLLFDGRKCHVRVYGLLTSDNRAFVHQRAFLHVANDLFTTKDATATGSFQDSIHITNCCANSHDESKFAGEILADFEQTEYTKRDGQTVVPLAKFFPSIRACVAALAKRTFPFLQGGQANHGFEYLGMDFMLSFNDQKQPVAYILEVNAPPSQDTATGLPHAENLHDDVLRDLTTLWVMPNIIGSNNPETPGGWRCVYEEENRAPESGEPIVPSKASILNKIRWVLYERREQKKEQQAELLKRNQKAEAEKGTQERDTVQMLKSESISTFARSQFPYFSDIHRRCPQQVFFENAGGSQVAQPVIDAVVSSLRYRHRSVVGSKTKAAARETLRKILGAEKDSIFLGPNATSLLAALADKYVQLGLLTATDEVVISTENHLANFEPWMRAAKASGSTVKLWTPFAKKDSHSTNGFVSSRNLQDLITSKTRIVAIPHASNILGQIRDIASLTNLIKARSEEHAHIVVDGVAAVPHFFAGFHESQVDWYVVSCHKLFGPHLGGLCGRRGGAVEQLSAAAAGSSSDESSSEETVVQHVLLESGTVNYEGCAGVVGLGTYFSSLSTFPVKNRRNWNSECSFQTTSSQSGEDCAETASRQAPGGLGADMQRIVSSDEIREAYRRIRVAEEPLVEALLRGLNRSSKIRILEGNSLDGDLDCLARLPTVCFEHASIAPKRIYTICEDKGICCRYSSFLCTEYLAQDFTFDHTEGVLRVSLAHYNTIHEIDSLVHTLESIPGWY